MGNKGQVRRDLIYYTVCLVLLMLVLCADSKNNKGAKNKKKTTHAIKGVMKKDEVEEDGENCDATDQNFVNTWTFEEMLQKEKIDIKGTRFCRFVREKDGCVHKFTRVCGRCPLGTVMIHLFGDVDLMVSSRKFIIPGKHQMTAMEVSECNGMKITITIRNREPQSLACNFLQLRKGGTIKVSWEHGRASSLEELEFSGGGPIVTEGDNDYSIKLSKDLKTDFVNASIVPPDSNSVGCAKYSELFGLKFDTFVPTDLNNVANNLQLDALSFENPESKGVIYPDDSFEFYLLGTIEASAMLSAQKNSFLVIQYFKSEGNEGDVKTSPIPVIIPRMALYVPFMDSGFRSKVSSITGLELPALTFLGDVKTFTFCIATKGMFMVLDDTLRGITEMVKSPSEQAFATAGVSFNFKKSNLQRKNTKQTRRSGISSAPAEAKFILRVNRMELVLETPEQIEATFKGITETIWDKGATAFDLVKHTTDAKVMLNSVIYRQGSLASTLTVTANITTPFQVAGPFSLDNVTLMYTSTKGGGGSYEDWKFNATGKNSFLDEETNITIAEVEGKGYVCIGDADLFSTGEIQNRTGASYLRPRFEDLYSQTKEFALSGIKYHAHFGAPDGVLRMRGKVFLPGSQDNAVEILYWTEGDTNHLVLGMAFYNSRFDRVVNLVFGENKMTQTWMTFDKIGIVFAEKKHDKTFEEDILKRAPQTDGIHIATSGLQLTKFQSNDTFKRMAYFLSARYGPYMELDYNGQFGIIKREDLDNPITSFEVSADIPGSLCTDSMLVFESLNSEIKSIAEGDVARVRCVMNFKRVGLQVPGVIYIDGSGTLRLKVASGENIETDKLLGVDFLKLSPMKMSMHLWSTSCPKYIKMTSGMLIGTNPDALIHFPWRRSDQDFYLLSDRNSVFTGITNALKLEDMLNAFKINSRLHFLKGAKCLSQTSVGYSGGVLVAWIPDIDERVTDGLNFFCSLQIPHGPLLDTKCTVLNSQEMTCRMRFPEAMKASNGNFRMSFSKTNDSFGPTLMAKFRDDGIEASLVGYTELPGLEKDLKIKISATDGGDDGMRSQFEGLMEGKIYDEYPAAFSIITKSDKPTNLDFSFNLEIKRWISGDVGKVLNSKVDFYYEMFNSARIKAKKNVEDVNKLLTHYTEERDKVAKEVTSNHKQIKAVSQSIEDASLSLSKDCLDECRTIVLPSLKLDDGCSSTTSSNARCYKWTEDDLKAIDVIELVKCQAKKISTYLSTKQNVTTIELLMHKLVKAKARKINLDIFVEEYTKMKDIADETNRIVDEKLGVCKEFEDIRKGITHPWFELKEIKSHGMLSEVQPPSFPFYAKWTILGKDYEEKLNVSFLFPFVESLGESIMTATFGTQDMRYAVDEANLRYQQQKRLRKEMTQIVEDKKPKSEGAAKRSLMKTAEHASLLKVANPVISQFSILSDSSILGYRKLSPWARIKKGSPLVARRNMLPSSQFGNLTSQYATHGNHCETAKRVLQWFHDVSDGLHGMLDNYNYGKSAITHSRSKLYNKLSDAEKYISHQVNTSGATGKHKDTMVYWLYPIKNGLQYWDNYHYGQLDHQNKNVIPLLKEELDHSAKVNKFGDVVAYMNYLGDTWTKAYRRGTTNGAEHSTGNEAQFLSEGLRDIFSSSPSLEQAAPKINALRQYVQETTNNLDLCQ